MKEEEIRTKIKEVVLDLPINGEVDLEDGLIIEPFKINDKDLFIYTNQTVRPDFLIAYMYRQESGRLMYKEAPEHGRKVLRKMGQQDVIWCPGKDQRIDSIICALKQCKDRCDSKCDYYINSPNKSKPGLEPVLITQPGYKKDEVEEVDINIYKHEFVCECGNKRYLKPQDVFQVKLCKPCVTRERREKLNKWRREHRKSK